MTQLPALFTEAKLKNLILNKAANVYKFHRGFLASLPLILNPNNPPGQFK